MGQSFSSCCKRARVAPQPVDSSELTVHQDHAPTHSALAADLRQALHAASLALCQRGGASKLSSSQTVVLLDGLLLAMLHAAALDPSYRLSPECQQEQQPTKAPSSVKQLLERIRQGCSKHGCSTSSVAAVVAPLSSHLLECWLQQHQCIGLLDRNSTNGCYEVAAANTVISWLHTLLYEQVSLETKGSLERKHQDYCSLRDEMGWSDSTLSVCLGPINKALLATILQGERCSRRGYGDAKLPVVVRREHAFWDAFGCAVQQGVVRTRGTPSAPATAATEHGVETADQVMTWHTELEPMQCTRQPQQQPQQQPPPQQQQQQWDPGSGPSSAAAGSKQQDRVGHDHCGRPHKLFPRFASGLLPPEGGDARGGLEAGEGHGPRKELFGLMGTDMARSQPLGGPADGRVAGGGEVRGGGSSSSDDDCDVACCTRGAAGRARGQGVGPLFVAIRSTGVYWMNPRIQESSAARQAYWFAGWLLAQAMPNRAVLGLELSPILFEKLVAGPAFKPDLEALQQHDSEAAASMHRTLDLAAPDVMELARLEGLTPGDLLADGAKGVVRRYVDAGVARLLVDDVAWQYKMIEGGFYTGFSREVLRACCMDASSLMAATCGGGRGARAPTGADVWRAFRIVTDGADGQQGGGGGSEAGGGGSVGLWGCSEAVVASCLWEVLDGWRPEVLAAFLRFTTGTDRLPPAGTEVLHISFPFAAYGPAQCRAALQMLPQAHTCTNTLELPDYFAALRVAEGGAGGSVAPVPSVPIPAAAATDHSAPGADAHARLRQRCREVLDERLSYAVMNSGQAYALDE